MTSSRRKFFLRHPVSTLSTIILFSFSVTSFGQWQAPAVRVRTLTGELTEIRYEGTGRIEMRRCFADPRYSHREPCSSSGRKLGEGRGSICLQHNRNPEDGGSAGEFSWCASCHCEPGRRAKYFLFVDAALGGR